MTREEELEYIDELEQTLKKQRQAIKNKIKSLQNHAPYGKRTRKWYS